MKSNHFFKIISDRRVAGLVATSLLCSCATAPSQSAARSAVAVPTAWQQAADTAAISILASNLIRNAIQHQSPDAVGGKVHISSGRENDRVFLSVRDNGPGIPAADLPHIFERFYRADKARSSKSGNTGLGLAIAQTIVENHGGTIEAQNLPAGGAVFTVKLPTRP